MPCGQLLDAVVACIQHIEIVLGIDGNADGLVKLSWLTSRRPPNRELLALRRELVDAVATRIGNVDVALVVDGNPSRSGELVGFGADCPPRRQQFTRG